MSITRLHSLLSWFGISEDKHEAFLKRFAEIGGEISAKPDAPSVDGPVVYGAHVKQAKDQRRSILLMRSFLTLHEISKVTSPDGVLRAGGEEIDVGSCFEALQEELGSIATIDSVPQADSTAKRRSKLLVECFTSLGILDLQMAANVGRESFENERIAQQHKLVKDLFAKVSSEISPELREISRLDFSESPAFVFHGTDSPVKFPLRDYQKKIIEAITVISAKPESDLDSNGAFAARKKAQWKKELAGRGRIRK